MNVLPLMLAAALVAGRGEVVARVDGVAITDDAVARGLEATRGRQGRPSPDDVVEVLIAELLLAAEGRKMGLAGTPEVALLVERQTRAAAAKAFADDLAAQVTPEEAMLRELFHSTADVVRFESLAFATRDEAKGALERIAGGATFAAVAPAAVVARVYDKPEEAPPSMRGELPAPLAASLFSAAPGDVLGPFDLTSSWLVARVLRKEVGTDDAFQANRESLVRHARSRLAVQARKHIVEQAKASIPVTVDESFLRNLAGAEATPAQLAHVIATVAGRPIEYREIHGSVRALGGHLSSGVVKLQLARQEVEDRVFEQLAVDRGYAKRPAVSSREENFRRAALAAACADRARAAAPAPSEQEIQAFYRRNAAAYGRPFAEVLPRVAADAAAQKREGAVSALVQELRRKASVSIDRQALARAARAG